MRKALILGAMILYVAGCSEESNLNGPALTSSGISGSKVFLGEIDEADGTVTLPLFRGTQGGTDVWYIVTDSSNREDAEERGVNWAPKLANALGTAAVQQVTVVANVVQFVGTVDFSPARVVVPGPMGFPPAQADPGSVGDAQYSPLITTGEGIVLNAPHVSNSTGLHDSAIDIDTNIMEATLELVAGFYHGKSILYISTEASDAGVAALEASTFAPNLNAAPSVGSNDPETSARAAITPFVNGETGVDNPERQGLNSALMGDGAPLNVTEEHPNHRGKIPLYSPLWDVHPARWTAQAISGGQRRRLDHHRDIAEAFEDGLLESAGAGPANPVLGGLRAAGFIVNCPIAALD